MSEIFVQFVNNEFTSIIKYKNVDLDRIKYYMILIGLYFLYICISSEPVVEVTIVVHIEA